MNLKFVWADGALGFANGFLKNVHHKDILQQLIDNGRIKDRPKNYIAGDFSTNDIHGPQFDTIRIVWQSGEHPATDEVRYLIQQELNRTARLANYKIWNPAPAEDNGPPIPLFDKTGDGSVRLFLAFDLPIDAYRQIEMWRQPILQQHPEFRSENHLHVTLAFIGDSPQERIAELDQAIEQLRQYLPMPSFGSPAYEEIPRLAWINWYDKSNFEDWFDAISKALEPYGWTAQFPDPVAHTTLWRFDDPPGLQIQPPQISWQAVDLSLYQSTREFGYQRIAATSEDTEPSGSGVGFLHDPHKELYPNLFRGADKIAPEVVEILKNHVLEPLEQEFTDPDKFIYFTIYGSGISYNWDESGDCDLQLWVDVEKYASTTNVPMDVDDLIASIRRIVQMVNFPSFNSLGLTDVGDTEETTTGEMLIQYYPKPGKGSKEENLASQPYACYDLETNEWLVKPKAIKPKFYGDNFLLLMPKAKDIALQAEALLGEYHRNVLNFQFWYAMYSRYRKKQYKEEFKEAMKNATQEKEGIANLFEGVFGGRAQAYSPEGQGIYDERDMIQKLLEVWGTFQDLKHFARAPLPWEEQEMPKPQSKWSMRPNLRVIPGGGEERRFVRGDYVTGAPGSRREGMKGWIEIEPNEDGVYGVQWYPIDSDIEWRSADELIPWGYSGPKLADLIHDIKRGGGGTFYGAIDPNEFRPSTKSEGFWVAEKGYEQILPLQDFNLDTIRKYVDHLTFDVGEYVGIWIDQGQAYLDKARWIPDLTAALDFGKQNGQQAIWDIGNQDAITVTAMAERRLDPDVVEELQRQIDYFSRILDVKVKHDPRVPDWGENFIYDPTDLSVPPNINVKPLVTEIDYWSVLHELGHLVFRHSYGIFQDHSFEEEEWAWRWAKDNSLLPLTREIDMMIHKALNTYRGTWSIPNPGEVVKNVDRTMKEFHKQPPRGDLPLQRHYESRFQKTAVWSDIMEKAQRLRDNGQVQIQLNEANHVVGQVQGDHGTYETEIWRDDPNSGTISLWNCDCPWSQYSWGRTRQWKKYEGRPCAHTLALYWTALATPIAQPQLPGMQQQPQQPSPVSLPDALKATLPAQQPQPTPSPVSQPQEAQKPGEQLTLNFPGALSKWRKEGIFMNGDIVRTNFVTEGYDDRGTLYGVPRNSVGEVLWSDDDDTIAIFSIESGRLGPHNVKVTAPTDMFTLLPRTKGVAPRRR